MLIAAPAACHGVEVWTPAKERDTKDAPRQVRPGYGNVEAHVWWPLTEPGLAALKGVEPAKQAEMCEERSIAWRNVREKPTRLICARKRDSLPVVDVGGTRTP